LERLVADYTDAVEVGFHPTGKQGRKVAIVGSGPAGLAAAHDLACGGYNVTVFESLPKSGGMLRFGIPEYRLPEEVLDRDIDYIRRLGVEIKCNTKVGRDIKLRDVQREYQAIFVATGAWECSKLNIPGEDNGGVVSGIDFLKSANMGEHLDIGDRVAIIGGGNVAIDAARVARRLGGTAAVIYHRSRSEMPTTGDEIEAALEEGVGFVFLATPVELIAGNGRVSKMKCIRMTLEMADASGRKRLVPLEGSEFTNDFDTVIMAVGQKPDLQFIDDAGLDTSPLGTLIVDEYTLTTNIEGVFAGGDVVTGPASVVKAIAAGKRAAKSIDNCLKGIPMSVEQTNRLITETQPTEEEMRALREQVQTRERVPGRELPPEERLRGFSEAELGYSPLEGQQEAKRCLNCNRGS